MSAFDKNPFADPVEVNPFQDPSVTQLANANQGGLDEFNPFSESSRLTNATQTVPATKPTSPSQPAVLQPSVEPTPQAVASAAQAGLLQQQEELERKAAELDRKERELQNSTAGFNPRQNNWPPLPKSCPVKPCFYQDFSADIPADYQRTCKMLYYLWMCTLKLRSDSSFSFFVFFFIFFCQIAIYIIQAVGIPNWGDSGWIAALSEIGHNLPVAIIMMVVASFFTICAVLSLILLKQVHSLYRRTGASFQRAQEEFSQGILTNRNFQNAATGVASSAAQSAFRGN
nr:secretory carrier-associated membrane protein 2 [Pogona vitticeps]